jgi:hypothetical protein
MNSSRIRHLSVTRLLLVLAAVTSPLLFIAGLLLMQMPAAASSHREAPLISKDPFADNTDTYVFIPTGSTDRITLIATWIPFEEPSGGPNYFEWDDNVLYEIHVDNDGDARSDITYTLRSKVNIGNPDTFLYNTGPIDSLNDPDWNRQQVYTITESSEGVAPINLVSGAKTPPVNIGSKSTPNYQALRDAATYQLTQGGDVVQIFAGQADDPFWVDLQVFDLLTLRGQNPPIGTGNSNNIPIDTLSGFNVHALAIEVPISRLTASNEPVLGVWATSRRPSMRVLEGLSGLGNQTHSGQPVQVSRLGMPLVNEVVLPLDLKDVFNSLPPQLDFSFYSTPFLGGKFQEAVENPELAQLLCALYGVRVPGDGNMDCNTDRQTGIPLSGRGDLFDTFYAGIVLKRPFAVNTASGTITLPAGTNVNRPSPFFPGEMIRINTVISGTICAPAPSRLGLLGGDLCGFPNGRRLEDDVVDVTLRAVAGAAYSLVDNTRSFVYDSSLNNVFDDGLDKNDVSFSPAFPYLGLPHSGEDRLHRSILKDFLPTVIKAANTVQSQAAENPVAATAAAGGGSVLLGLPAIVWWRRRRESDTGSPRRMPMRQRNQR